MTENAQLNRLERSRMPSCKKTAVLAEMQSSLHTALQRGKKYANKYST